MRHYFLLLLLAILLTSCKKIKSNKDNRIRLKSNAPVKVGQALKVWVEENDDMYYYTLIHPLRTFNNGTFSTDSARIGDGGWYVTEVFGEEVFGEKDSVFVKVEIPKISCTPPRNGLELVADGQPRYYFSGSRDTTDSGFEVWGYENDYWIFFRFHSEAIQNKTATYVSIYNYNRNLHPNQVHCYAIKNGYGYYNQSGQPVYVSVEDGLMSISLCDFSFGPDSDKISVNTNLTFKL